ncbi:hypothetical protein D4764_01G0007390 [Takifugu flavidus]|uniref:Uncharacterized protein n=1 Tax=Takifugu flavidus TaxID=433684 RepID=A0A5C6PMI8_9TELE|nr:hypothetical protein D4764_01G0007390 [Takifugu flavidus]
MNLYAEERTYADFDETQPPWQRSENKTQKQFRINSSLRSFTSRGTREETLQPKAFLIRMPLSTWSPPPINVNQTGTNIGKSLLLLQSSAARLSVPPCLCVIEVLRKALMKHQEFILGLHMENQVSGPPGTDVGSPLDSSQSATEAGQERGPLTVVYAHKSFTPLAGLAKATQHNAAQVCPNGPGGGSRRISAPISPKLQLFIIKPRTAALRIGLPCEISAPHWTTLGGQKLGGGREDFSTRIHGASASANKVFPEEGGTASLRGHRQEKNGYRSEMSPGGGPACARCQEASSERGEERIWRLASRCPPQNTKQGPGHLNMQCGTEAEIKERRRQTERWVWWGVGGRGDRVRQKWKGREEDEAEEGWENE